MIETPRTMINCEMYSSSITSSIEKGSNGSTSDIIPQSTIIVSEHSLSKSSLDSQYAGDEQAEGSKKLSLMMSGISSKRFELNFTQGGEQDYSKENPRQINKYVFFFFFI